MNKIRTFIKSTFIALFTVALFTVMGSGVARAAQIPYVEGQALPAPNTPAFNIYTNVPSGVGNEADFVKLRKSNGDPTVPATTNNFIDPVDATCNVGEKFDVRTYIHNGANADANNNGSGTAVAHNVVLKMHAPLNVKDNKFAFASTVSATNAVAVSDIGTLNCGKDAELKLVPNTVHVYSTPYGWKSADDSAVNGSMNIGSPNFGTSDQWGCWQYRVVVVYTVEVKPVPPTPTPTPTPTPVTPTAKVLPNTGAGDVLGIFAATTIAGTVAYRLRLRAARRRLNV